MRLAPDTETRFRVKAAVRRFNRLRWYAKARNIRTYGANDMPLLERVRYVLWDPELGDYSYELPDLERVAQFLADHFDVTKDLALALLQEPSRDQRLLDDYAALRRRTQLRSRMELGHRPLLWALIRLRRPTLVVETGLWYGLGAMVMLRALERNVEDGGPPGRLISFDPDPTGGWMVPERHSERWTWVQATTTDALAANLAGLQVDLFLHDTPPEFGLEYFEFTTAAEVAAPGALLCGGNGRKTPALRTLCEERGFRFLQYDYDPTSHFYRGNGVSIGVVPGVDQPA